VGPPEDPRVPLRLTVTRGALGMELYEPIEIGPLSVERLSLTFAGLRFPVDLSGGVPRFRSRRGELQEIVLRLRLSDLARFGSKRVGAPFGPLVKPLAAWSIAGGIGVGLVAEDAGLAFDLLWAADHGAARFVLANARGIGLAGPALSVALRACDAVIEGFGERSGRIVTISDVGGRIGRALLPAVGARAPASVAVSFGDLFQELDELLVGLDATFPPSATSDAATRALELARLTREADDALAESRVDEAREKLLEALEQAPRHPEIVRLLCELDAAVPGRADLHQEPVAVNQRGGRVAVVAPLPAPEVRPAFGLVVVVQVPAPRPLSASVRVPTVQIPVGADGVQEPGRGVVLRRR